MHHETPGLPPSTGGGWQVSGNVGPGAGGVQGVPPGGNPITNGQGPFSVGGFPIGPDGRMPPPDPDDLSGTPPGPLSTPGNIAAPYELDGYLVHLQPNVAYGVAVIASAPNGLPDPFLAVADLNTQQIITVADDGLQGEDNPAAGFTVPVSGDYLVVVGDVTGGTGTYDLAVADSQGQIFPTSFVIDYQADPPNLSTQSPPDPSSQSQFGVMGVQESAGTDLSLLG